MLKITEKVQFFMLRVHDTLKQRTPNTCNNKYCKQDLFRKCEGPAFYRELDKKIKKTLAIPYCVNDEICCQEYCPSVGAEDED